MIQVSLSLRNPWGNRQKYEPIREGVYETPFKHKYLELNVYRDDNLLTLSMNLTHRQDHAGLDVHLGFAGYNLHVNLYDNRHWNYEKNRYYIYTEEKGWD